MSIFREFLLHPRLTGAVAASSPRLARALTDGLGLERAHTVVELGPGTGAVTDVILRRMPPGARLVAVERNPNLAAHLAARYRGRPVRIVTGTAEDLAGMVDAPVDAVVSGLPWTVIPHGERRRILDAVTTVLAPGGGFSTFAYSHAAWTPPARHFAAELRARFRTVSRTRCVWTNLPPAFVHRASR
jgi:phosphatidylethanolamine/phosphatidyl-N-methylethanolamine N-methyltransferase